MCFMGFFPVHRVHQIEFEDMHIRLIGHFKLPIGVNVSLNDCLSLCSPADELATCPEYTLSLSQYRLGLASASL